MKPIELECNGYVTRETAVEIPSSKELLIPLYYLQYHKRNYNRETIGLEFKYSDFKYIRNIVSSVTIKVE